MRIYHRERANARDWTSDGERETFTLRVLCAQISFIFFFFFFCARKPRRSHGFFTDVYGEHVRFERCFTFPSSFRSSSKTWHTEKNGETNRYRACDRVIDDTDRFFGEATKHGLCPWYTRPVFVRRVGDSRTTNEDRTNRFVTCLTLFASYSFLYFGDRKLM